MNHNPHNLLPGDIVMLDNDKGNRSEVLIVKMTPGQMFSSVIPANKEFTATLDDEWDVMTTRLTPKPPEP